MGVPGGKLQRKAFGDEERELGGKLERKREEGSSLSRSASLPPASRERARVKRRAPLPPGMQQPRRQQSEDRKESISTVPRGLSRAEPSTQKSMKKEFDGSLGRRESLKLSTSQFENLGRKETLPKRNWSTLPRKFDPKN